MKKYLLGLVTLFMLMTVSNKSYANQWVAVPVVTQQVVYQPVVYSSVQYYYVPVAPPVLVYYPAPVWYRYKPWCCY